MRTLSAQNQIQLSKALKLSSPPLVR